jgi:hypothetical protein
MQSGIENRYHSLDQLGAIRQGWQNPSLTIRQALFVADQLVNQACPEAVGMITRLREALPPGSAGDYLTRLEKRHAAIQALPVLPEIWSDQAAVRSLYETSGHVFRRGGSRADTVIVVFTSKFNNFHVSNVVMDALLTDLGVSRLYLKDTTASIFFRGVAGFATGFLELPDAIRAFMDREGLKQAIITGFSSGGYAALMTALHMDHIGFAGFSCNTDISPDSPLPVPNVFASLRGWLPDPLFQDTRALFETRPARAPYKFYYGANDPHDMAHAVHLSGLASVEINQIEGANHQTTSAMMENGELANPFVEILSAAGV